MNVDQPYGTCVQTFGDGRTWEWEEKTIEHVLLKPKKLSEPDSEHCTNPRRPWDGTSISFKAMPRDQVGEQTDPRENAEEVREYPFYSFFSVTIFDYDKERRNSNVFFQEKLQFLMLGEGPAGFQYRVTASSFIYMVDVLKNHFNVLWEFVRRRKGNTPGRHHHAVEKEVVSFLHS